MAEELQTPGVLAGTVPESPFQESSFESKSVDRPSTFPAKLEALTGKEFKVRSAGYQTKKKKEISLESLYELVGADFFKTDKKILQLGTKITLPFLSKAEKDAKETKHPGLPVLFMAHFMAPSFEPSYFGTQKMDGPGYSVVFYFRIKDSTVKLFEKPDQLPTSVRLMQAFCKSVQGGGDQLRGRLKCIPLINNAKDLDFGMATEKLVSAYNGKPFLTGPKFHTFCGNANWLECDMDLYKYTYPARKVLFESWDKFGLMDISFGFTIEGYTDDELPEQIFGAGRFSGINLKQVKSVKDFYPDGPIWPQEDSSEEITETLAKASISGDS